jgi:hypothetical protein
MVEGANVSIAFLPHTGPLVRTWADTCPPALLRFGSCVYLGISVHNFPALPERAGLMHACQSTNWTRDKETDEEVHLLACGNPTDTRTG